MEAAVMDREAEMTEWNDGRLDELSKRVDDGFAHMREEFTSVNKRIDHIGGRIDHLSTRFDALQRILMQVGGGIFVALIGLIATQV
jgi:tetrahydromethanopterin S-methyltransferase subunit G